LYRYVAKAISKHCRSCIVDASANNIHFLCLFSFRRFRNLLQAMCV